MIQPWNTETRVKGALHRIAAAVAWDELHQVFVENNWRWARDWDRVHRKPGHIPRLRDIRELAIEMIGDHLRDDGKAGTLALQSTGRVVVGVDQGVICIALQHTGCRVLRNRKPNNQRLWRRPA